MEFGIWPSQYALGEKLFYASRKGTYSDESCKSDLRSYLKYVEDMERHQKWAEQFLQLLGGSHGGSSALFGPIDRSKENTERMHAITLSMGADTGKHNNTPNAYNAATVPIYALQNRDGSYVLPSGGHTKDKEKARVYTDQSEAESHRLSTQTIVEI